MFTRSNCDNLRRTGRDSGYVQVQEAKRLKLPRICFSLVTRDVRLANPCRFRKVKTTTRLSAGFPSFRGRLERPEKAGFECQISLSYRGGVGSVRFLRKFSTRIFFVSGPCIYFGGGFFCLPPLPLPHKFRVGHQPSPTNSVRATSSFLSGEGSLYSFVLSLISSGTGRRRRHFHNGQVEAHPAPRGQPDP